MTIFLLTRNFPPLICGVGDYTFELYQRLKRRGYAVRVITGYDDRVATFIKEYGLEKDVFPIVKTWGFASIKQIVTTLRREKADWFCLQYVPNGFSRFALPFFLIVLLIRLFFSRTKTGVFFHEVSVRIWFSGIRAFFWGLAQRSISYSLYLLSDFSITSNPLNQRHLRPFNVPAVFIPANIYKDDKDSQTKEGRGSLRSRVVLSSFINRCSPQVIRAVSDCILCDRLTVHFIIVGSSSEKRREEVRAQVIAAKIEESVSILDKTDKDEIAEVLQTADIFLHMEGVTARGEGGVSTKSGVMAAALAAGLPIIGSFGDMTDRKVYTDGENILFADPSSSDSIRRRINQLYADESLRKKMAANSLLTHRNFFEWDKVVDSFVTQFSRN